MKKIILLLTVALICSELSGQDILVMKNGEEFQVKVTDIESKELVYKKWENLEGPNYRVDKSDVFMIKYQNGTKEVFGESKSPAQEKVQADIPEGTLRYGGSKIFVGKEVVKPELALDIDLYERWNSGRNMDKWGTALWGGGSGCIVLTIMGDLLGNSMGVDYNGALGYLLGGISILVGVPLDIIGTSKMKQAIDSQNARRANGTAFTPTFDIGTQRYGFGIAMKF